MVGGIRYEYTHRVIATCIGLLTIGLAVWLWRVEKRGWMRWLGLAALGGVIAQGILGGMTVRMFQPPPVSAAHATLAQLFFSTVVAIAVFTSAWWDREVTPVEDPKTPHVRSLVVWTTVAVFLQLILGAAFRHKAFGIIPHLIGAVIVTILDLYDGRRPEETLSKCAGAAKLRQALALPDRDATSAGGGAYWSRIYGAQFPQPIPVMVALTVVHTVTGALLLAASLVTALITYRLVGVRKLVGESFGTTEQVAQ